MLTTVGGYDSAATNRRPRSSGSGSRWSHRLRTISVGMPSGYAAHASRSGSNRSHHRHRNGAGNSVMRARYQGDVMLSWSQRPWRPPRHGMVCGDELVEVFCTARPRGLSHFSEELGENGVESLGIFPEHHVAAKDLHP